VELICRAAAYLNNRLESGARQARAAHAHR